MWWLLQPRGRQDGTRLGPLAILTLALTIVAALGTLAVAPPASASHVPMAHDQGQTSLPSARPSRPPINPVGDDNVVVPGEPATSSLPASGVGSTQPIDALRNWTMVAVALLALNAVVLAGFAVRSLLRQRVA
ncbi:MAG TPA: hypothetical protein VGT61_06300 [Thermomicrobiales bacterium]|jgi:hypothetical protein|nr:hypothetical protein [Thermomicrobiales bacterium]